MRYSFSRFLDTSIGVSGLIFGFGSWQLAYHARFWALEPPGLLELALYVFVTFVIGSFVGLIVGSIALLICRFIRRHESTAFQIGYFAGLDIVAIIALCLLPPMA